MSQLEKQIAKALESGKIDTQAIADLLGMDERHVQSTLEAIAPYVRVDNADKVLLEQVAEIRSGLSTLDASSLSQSHVEAIGTVLSMIESQTMTSEHSPESLTEAQRLHRALKRRISD